MHLLVASGRDASDEDLEHPIGQAAVLANRLVGGDFDLSRLSQLGVLLAEPGLVDAEFTFPERDASLLGAVVDDVAVGLLALLLGPGQLGGAHQQDGLDGGAAHDVDEVVDGGLGVLDQVEHGQEELAVLGEDVGEGGGIERGRAVLGGNDVVAFSHRWWLLCKGLTTSR